MEIEEWGGVLLIVLAIVIASTLWWHIGYAKGEYDMRGVAIEQGVAEYVLIDPTTGETEFQWR